ncbi:MAG: hypothetical protein ACK5NK_05640 [Niabella sp.]
MQLLQTWQGNNCIIINRKLLLLIALFSLLIANCSCSKTALPANTDDTDSTGNPNGNNNNPGEYGDLFLYGSNMGYYPGWTDQQLSDILIGSTYSPGVGVNSLRPALYDYFVETWGYNIRIDAFKYYQQLGATTNVLFLNGPSDAHRDKTRYCASHESEIFANLYEPIWNSNGEINPHNYYANYVYNVVKLYSPYIKYWEVWNEPDYTYNWNASQTWEQKDPNPCDLNGFYAPIQSYVRMLRITSEIVKNLDPDGQICLGGIGYEGFLDAILRNTDNPNEGATTADYPKTGGHWFDCVSYHIYPMFSLNAGNNNSDAAAEAIINKKNKLETVLTKYQLGGKKTYIVTECNIPRKAFGDYIGSDQAQKNFMIKAAVTSQKAGIKGLYIYGPAESETLDAATEPYQVMGFYQKMGSSPFTAVMNNSGISWRTASRLLGGRHYDATKTTAMQLPANVGGGAFYSITQNNYVYVLWAKTSGSNEAATADYSVPSSLGISTATQYAWDERTSGYTGNTIRLSSSPIFIK